VGVSQNHQSLESLKSNPSTKSSHVAIHFFHRLSAYGEMNVVKSRRVLAFVVMLLDSEIQILRSNWS